MGPFPGEELECFQRPMVLWLKELRSLIGLQRWEWGLVHEGPFCLRSVFGNRSSAGGGDARGVRANDGDRCS
jgi:hypothetical protein